MPAVYGVAFVNQVTQKQFPPLLELNVLTKLSPNTRETTIFSR